MDGVHLFHEDLKALPTPFEPEDAELFAKAYQSLQDYVLGGYPGGDEGLQGAADLARALRERADDFALRAWDREWIALQDAGMRMQLDCVEEAEEIVADALRAPSHPRRAAELGILGAQVAQRLHRYDEADRRLDAAELSLAGLPESFERTDLEAHLACARVYLLLEIGLTDRAKEPLARALELARGLFASSRDRLRLDDALLYQVAQFQADIEHGKVLELLRSGAPELPDPDSSAARRLVLREATSRAELEFLGSAPADRAERDPVALLRTALASGMLLRSDEEYAREWLVSTLIDRGELAPAARELEALRAMERPDRCQPPRFVDGVVVLETRLALLRGERDELARLRASNARAWQDFLARWKPLARTSELAPLYFEEVGKLARGLVDLHLALDGPERGAELALAELVSGQVVGSLAQAMAAPIPDLAEIRALLAADEVALLHLPVREQGRVLVIARGEVSVHALPSLPRILEQRRTLARRLDSALREADGQAWRDCERAATELAGSVLPEEVARVVGQAGALAILAPENLGYVPFELLPGADGEPLGSTHRVRYLPSLPVAAALARRRAARAGAVTTSPELALLLADRPGALAEATYPPLEVEAAALDRLRAPFGTSHASLTGPAAERDGLRALLGREPRALFVLAHGHSERGRERPVSLVLAGADPRFSAAEAESLRAPPLVTLATCGAWEGPRRRGDDGRAHLPSAFLLAGSDTVVAAESPLLLEPALSLFTHFHEHLRAGLSPTAALLEARRASARAASARERALAQLVHVIGLGDQPLFSPTPGPDSTTEDASGSAAPRALDEKTGPGVTESGPSLVGFAAPIAAVALVAILLTRRRRAE